MRKLMTIAEAETARRRAVTGLRNLGRDDDADYYDDLDAMEYADVKGIELIAENPDERTCTKMPRAKTAAELREQIADLKERVGELEDENESLSEQLDNIADIVSPDDDQDDDTDDDNGDDYEDPN
jgi:hypothetical protein